MEFILNFYPTDWEKFGLILNPYWIHFFICANPIFWYKYIIFFQGKIYLNRILNPYQTRLLPVQTHTIYSDPEGSHLYHYYYNNSLNSYKNKYRIGIIEE